MAMTGISPISARQISANYGSSIPPVRPAKKVDYADQMVVPVKETATAEKAYNDIAKGMQGQNNYYDASLRGGNYDVIGSNFDCYC